MEDGGRSQKGDELACFGSVVFIACVNVREAVEDDEAGLVFDDLGDDRAPQCGWGDAPRLDRDGHHCIPIREWD